MLKLDEMKYVLKIYLSIRSLVLRGLRRSVIMIILHPFLGIDP